MSGAGWRASVCVRVVRAQNSYGLFICSIWEGIDIMDKRRYMEGLAWDCVAAGMSPPLAPTTCAIVRLVALEQGCTMGRLLEVVPCSEAAVRQQLSRLVRAGVLDKSRVQCGAGRWHGVYRLSAGGVRMVLQWEREHARVMKKLLTIDD